MILPSGNNVDLALAKRKNPCLYHKRLLLLFTGVLQILALQAQPPVADFSANVVSGCSPLVVTYRDQSTGNPVFWNWDLGNGQLSNLQNPTTVYYTPGTYAVTLVVRNADGTNGVTKTNFITVNPSPAANFSANITTACLPATIQFTDLSTPQAGTLTQWQWDFGDGTTSTQQNPQKTYSATGFYSVTLTVTSSTGCKGTVGKSRYIRVVSGVIADFDFTPPATCRPPFLVNFSNLTSGPGNLTYLWDFGNSTGSGQTNPISTYAAPGTYTVRLQATSEFGCSNSIQKNITINGTTTAINSPDSVCLNSPVVFSDNSNPPPLNSSWDFGNGRQSSKPSDTSSYTAPGSYTIRLVNTYAQCSDSAIKTIYVRPNPVVDFAAPLTIACKAPFTVNFQDISPDATGWLWDFGDGNSSTVKNPVHTYNTEGRYTVTLSITDSKGCRNSISKTDFIQIVKPAVAISNVPAGGCIPFAFSPVANVSAIDGVASYFWDFGDAGFTSTLPNPSHTYNNTGNYTIKLRITTNGGCTDSVVVVNAVRTGTPPGTNFSAAPVSVCASTNVSFTDLSTTADAWLWIFGDGTTSNLQNPQHAYRDTGLFTVSLTAYNNGCSQTFTRNQYIRVLAPVAGFRDSVNCANRLQVNFTDTSKTDPTLVPLTYFWEFGDPANSTSVQQNPVFTYPALGTYTVKLTVTNGSCSNTFIKTITLSAEIADFTISKSLACKNENINFNATGSNPANIALYEWSVNGAPFFTGPRGINRSFAINGTYSIALRITDNNGCTDTKTINPAVTVSGPTASFSPNIPGACANSVVSFNDASSGSPVRWTWDFGDGSVQAFTSPPFSHLYADTGTFSVKLTVQDANGCIDSSRSSVPVVITRPRADFSADKVLSCPRGDITFTNKSSGKGLSYVWDFGDGSTSTLPDPVHPYAGNDSVYSVKLVITDSLGCSDSLRKFNYITVKKPKPAFDISDTSSLCPPFETRFTFRGQDFESFYWDFGDGSTSTLTNPIHFYNSYGDFQAKLFLIGFGGCLDSAVKTVHVYDPYATTSLQYNPLTACNELLVDFNITPTPGMTFTFYASDGFVDSSQLTNFQHLYKSLGYYAPYVILRDKGDCRVQVGGPNTIRILGAEPLFGLDKKSFCDSGTVLFANYTIANDPVISSVWNFGDGTTSTVKDPAHTFNFPGTYIVSLTANTQSGCSKTLTDTVRVYGTPSPIIRGDTVVCIGETLNLQGSLVQPDTAITWNWSFGNGGVSSLQNPSASYSASGNYTIRLETANKLGCKQAVSRNVFVPPAPIINILDNPTIVVGTGTNLPVNYGPLINTYTWSPPTGLSCTDCPVPFADPRFTTTYRIAVEDIYGCRTSENITVTVICNEKNFFVPNTFSPNNDGRNDVFYPRGKGLTRVQSLRIFNRWGELVFERRNFAANDPSMGWDGNYKGRPAEQGVYIYVIEFVCENASIVPYRGNVALIR